ncbi:MAG: hypothetical protein GKR99_05535 [Rhodobacteraceae bacterium]|nr:hypothetical protein [Paracoccaceae bacterium]
MDDSADDKLRERFATLTDVFEDAAALAVEGQGRDLSTADLGLITLKIDRYLAQPRQIFMDINSILDHDK